MARGSEAALSDAQSGQLGDTGGQVLLNDSQLSQRLVNQETDFLQGADNIHLIERERELVGHRKTSQSQYSIY